MRCPNCFNELPVDVTCCPSCTFLLPAHFQTTEANVLTDLAAVTGTRTTADVMPKANVATEAEPSVAELGVPEGEAEPAGPNLGKNAWGLKRTAPLQKPDTNGKAAASPRTTGPRPNPLGDRSFVRRDIKKGRYPSKTSKEKAPSKVASIAGTAIVAILVFGGGIYLYLFTDVIQGRVTAEKALSTLSTFRNLPSATNGMTVDQVASSALLDSRKSGRLERHIGWITRPIKGERSKVLVIFSYEEKDDGEHKAQWVVDLSTGQVTAQTDLARAIYADSTFPDPDKK